VNTQLYVVQSEQNTSHFKIEALSECTQPSNRFTLAIQWFNTSVSYFLPLCVLIVCYIKILLFLARHRKQSILSIVSHEILLKCSIPLFLPLPAYVHAKIHIVYIAHRNMLVFEILASYEGRVS
jgi:hypothetical protein